MPLPTITRDKLFAIFKNEEVVRTFELLLRDLNSGLAALEAAEQSVEESRLLAALQPLIHAPSMSPAFHSMGRDIESARLEAAAMVARISPPKPDPLEGVMMARTFAHR